MFEVARDKARLRTVDMAKLLRVHRCTVSSWYNGHTEPHFLLMPRIQKLLDAITRAVEANELPVPREVVQRERAHYINRVLVRHLRQQS